MKFNKYVKEEKRTIRDKRIDAFKKKIINIIPSSKIMWGILFCFILMTFLAPLISFLGDKALDSENLTLRLFIINGSLFALLTYVFGMLILTSNIDNKIEKLVKNIIITHTITIVSLYILMQYGSFIRTLI